MKCTLPDDIQETVTRALAEDLGDGDLTAALVPAGLSATATVRALEDMVLCGAAWFDESFRQFDAGVSVYWQAADGDRCPAGSILCTLEGPARALLTGERTALNFLQTLSGTATTAARWAEAVAGSGTRVLDTRKTIPGLRRAQKYAVCIGGCDNHRQGLWDAILIKENHITALGGIGPAVEAARRACKNADATVIEVEVEDLDQLDQALDAGCGWVMLDNFDTAQLAEAVRRTGGRARLEASGNITLDTLPDIIATGVDLVSTGALSKHVRAVDLSMRIVYK